MSLSPNTPRVEACIAAVMKRFPSEKSTAYFTEVHQHLAPLARNLEIEAAALLVENEALRVENQRLWKAQASAAPDDAYVESLARDCRIWPEPFELVPSSNVFREGLIKFAARLAATESNKGE